MTDNNYSLKQISDYAESKVSKALGYATMFIGGYNLILDAIQMNVDVGTVPNTLATLGGLVLASGLENKLMKRDQVAKEITGKIGY